MKSGRTAGAIAVVTLFVVSCAPTRPTLLSADTDVRSLISLVRASQERVWSVTGSGAVTFDSPEMAGTAAFDLSLKKPDSLLVRFEGPFGIDLGTLFMSREKYLVYVSMENRVITGKPGPGTLRSVIPFDLSPGEIVGAFSGTFPIMSDSGSVTVEEDALVITIPCGAGTCRYWIDRTRILVTRYELLDGAGDVMMIAVAERITESDDVSAATAIRVAFPRQERQIFVRYSSIMLNDPHPSFQYEIPAGARVTHH
jgi:hypothetical protein